MKYLYHDMGDYQFQDLAIAISRHLFGQSVKIFSSGADGGRDSFFEGTAENFPSKASPWKGKVVIQSKHTNGINKSFSDSDFFSETGAKSSELTQECKKIKKLFESKEIDYYLLISNRKLSASSNSKIKSFISKNTGLQESNVHLCGLEEIEGFLKTNPSIVKEADIDPIDSPLSVSPDELSEVIDRFAIHKKTIIEATKAIPILRTSFEDKNKINDMTQEYALQQEHLYMKDVGQIHEFLQEPENEDLLHKYQDAVDEFQSKIIANRKDYQNFDKVLEYLSSLLIDRDAILRKHKRLTRSVVFYMYWICDLGESNVSES